MYTMYATAAVFATACIMLLLCIVFDNSLPYAGEIAFWSMVSIPASAVFCWPIAGLEELITDKLTGC